ncbi:hypothetical protein B6U96_17660 [Archaeoglobales archaeon ex4484_92]|nr:MAG: hypothetical protein B6U96_17660 [Archaeoglobales archaeon ex4484_92]
MSLRRRQREAYERTLIDWLAGMLKPQVKARVPQPRPIRKQVVINKPPKRTAQANLQLEAIKVKPFVLRPYQQEALNEFLKLKKGIIMHPTGTGKTITALEAIRIIGTPVIIFVPTIAILRTVWVKRLKEQGWMDVGEFYGAKKELREITVSTYQSGIRYINELKRLHPKLVIFDEIHHCHSSWGKVLELAELAPYALGLTATISRWDSKNARILSVMPIIHSMTIAEARKNGWVSPIQVLSAKAQMNGAEAYEYEKLQEIIRKTAFALGTSDPTKWSKLAKLGYPEARKGLWALSRRRMLLSDVEDKYRLLLEIVKKHCLNEKILVFSESIASIEKAAQILRARGIKCGLYHSKMPKQDRLMALQRWGKDFNVLLSVAALEEGIDVPSCSVGILHASGRTPRKLVQRIGRIIRPAPGKIAKIYVIHVPYTVEDRVLRGVQRAVWRVR